MKDKYKEKVKTLRNKFSLVKKQRKKTKIEYQHTIDSLNETLRVKVEELSLVKKLRMKSVESLEKKNEEELDLIINLEDQRQRNMNFSIENLDLQKKFNQAENKLASLSMTILELQLKDENLQEKMKNETEKGIHLKHELQEEFSKSETQASKLSQAQQLVKTWMTATIPVILMLTVIIVLNICYCDK